MREVIRIVGRDPRLIQLDFYMLCRLRMELGMKGESTAAIVVGFAPEILRAGEALGAKRTRGRKQLSPMPMLLLLSLNSSPCARTELRHRKPQDRGTEDIAAFRQRAAHVVSLPTAKGGLQRFANHRKEISLVRFPAFITLYTIIISSLFSDSSLPLARNTYCRRTPIFLVGLAQ